MLEHSLQRAVGSVPAVGLRLHGPLGVTAPGVFLACDKLGGAMAQPVAFIIDGFDLYHSVVAACERHGRPLKWLDIRAVCESYLHEFGRLARVEGVYYYSALAHHLGTYKPDVVRRHELFLRALRSTGIVVQLGRFKAVSVRCKHCSKEFDRHEEKETDVALAAKMFEILAHRTCNTIVIMRGDTDLMPAVRVAKTVYPDARICFAFPFQRHSADLRTIADHSFKMKVETYARHQFPDPLVLRDGAMLRKPPSW